MHARILAVLVLVLSLAVPSARGAEEGPAPGTTTILAGGSYGDGLPAPRAALDLPRGIAAGDDGIYVSDFFNHQVRRIDEQGIIRKVAGTLEGFAGDGGPATSAKLNRPMGLDHDAAGNLYVAEAGSNRIRRIDAETGTISTLAGNGQRTFGGDGGPATGASLSFPYDVGVGPDGSIYVADYENLRVRRVAPDGSISTFAGNGTGLQGVDGVPATASPIDAPTSVAVDPQGVVYIADEGNCSIRRVGTDGIITTVAGGNGCGFAGDGGPATEAQLGSPYAVDLDPQGRLWISDAGSRRLRVVETDGTIRTIAGDGTAACRSTPGPATGAGLMGPWGAAFAGDDVFLVAQGSINDTCQRVFRIDASGTMSVAAGNGDDRQAGTDGDPATALALAGVEAVAEDAQGRVHFADSTSVWRIDHDGTARLLAGASGGGDADGPGAEARFRDITAIAFDDAGDLWIADRGADKVKRLSGGVVTTEAGTGEVVQGWESSDGPALETELYIPHGLAVAPDGAIWIAEAGRSGRLRTLAGGMVTTMNAGQGSAGDGGPLAEARFHNLRGISFGPGGTLYVADHGNNRVRAVGPDGVVRTIGGDGGGTDRGDGTIAELASFPHPYDVAADAAGNVFVAQGESGVVRQIAPNGMVSRIAGTGAMEQGPEGPSLETPLHYPTALALGARGLLVADTSTVRLVTAPAGGWPEPARAIVCDPYLADVRGDGTHRVLGANRTPNRAWLDIVSGGPRTVGDRLHVTLELDDLSETIYAPYVGSTGTPNVWAFLFIDQPSYFLDPAQFPNPKMTYLAAIGPQLPGDGTLDSLITFEYGEAERVNPVSDESFYLTPRGRATGTIDLAADTIELSAPLEALGMDRGDRMVAQVGATGALTDTGLARYVVRDDLAPDGGTSRAYEVGRNCPDALIDG